MADTPIHLLLVEDELLLRAALAEQLRSRGFTVVEAESGEDALARLAEFAFDVVVTDLRLPGLGGVDVLAAATERYPDIIVIVMTGYGTVRDAVAAIKQGASDFLTKPFAIDELLHVLNTALEQRRLRSENAYLRSQLEARYRFEGLIGRSRRMREMFDLLETVAATSSTILITGETGTGKELVARAIHHNSPRRQHRFAALNCGAIPESLLEAELFGHVRGAFTGATNDRQGRLEQAHRGTLFLDEIGTMSAALQAKLLRVLQEREFERIGGTESIKIDVRVIAATNSDLDTMVSGGSFRQDLYYRLKVIPIAIPPLRERREDIALLAQHFLDRIGREQIPSRTGVTFTQEAMRRLMSYDWPGNVRQLENITERALTLSPGRHEIEEAALPPEIRSAQLDASAWAIPFPDEGVDLDSCVRGVERYLIDRAIERSNGNKRQAARLLKLKRTTLLEKMKRLRNDGSVVSKRPAPVAVEDEFDDMDSSGDPDE